MLLTPDVLELPRIVRELAEAQKRAEERLARAEERLSGVEERLARLEQAVTELVEAQKRAEERLARAEGRLLGVEERLALAKERLLVLEQKMADLAEAQRQLAEAQRKTEEKLQKLIDRVDLLSIQVDELRGDMLEMRYRQRAFGYFGRIISRAQVVELQEIWEEYSEPNLSEEEREDLLSLDLLVRGKLNRALAGQIEIPELWLAVEVSGVVDQSDVRRAKRRADLLSKAGLRVLPVAAGRDVTQGAAALATEVGVVLQKDGSLLYVEEGLARLK